MTDEVVEIKDPKAVLEALERAKADAKKYREALADLETKYTALESTKGELEAQIEEYGAKEGAWKAKAKELQVKSLIKSNHADRIMKFMDMSSIDFDEENNLVGFDSELDRIKQDLPELFDVKRQVGAVADAFTPTQTPKTMTGTEMQVAQLFKEK